MCRQAQAGPGEGTEGLALLGHTEHALACRPRLWLIPKLGQAGKSPGMTEGVLNSSSDYGFCESGCVCINWTWLLATGFPAHNHYALKDLQLCHYRNYYGGSISALLQTHSGWSRQSVVTLRE